MYRENLKVNAGGYYPKMKLNPELYLRPCGDALKKWLTELKKRQVTYLISGSDPDYVEWVAGYCLGNDWKTYFDYIVCASKKPGFFSGERPFRRWNHFGYSHNQGVEDEDIDIDEDLAANGPAIYVHGNWNQLKCSMAEYCGVDHPKCLYFGDHLIQDVVAADLSRLDVVAMVEELAAENQTGPDISLLYSKRWGSFFYDQDIFNCSEVGGNNGPAKINTLWGDLLRKHSRICISYMETLSDYPADHGFTFTHNGQQTFLGFLPSLPICLK